MSDRAVNSAAIPPKQSQIHIIQTGPSKKDDERKERQKSKAQTHKNKHSTVSATDTSQLMHFNGSGDASCDSNRSQAIYNDAEPQDIQDIDQSHNISTYQPILRSWKNIKRAGKETAISNAAPMERWNLETVGDQPWNAVDGVSRRYGVIFETHHDDGGLLGAWDTRYEGLEYSSMVCEDNWTE